MYAIVNIARQQFKVAKDQYLFVLRLQGDEGASIEFDDVLLAEDAGKFTVGAPTIEGAKVSATILSRLKGDKVIVFKNKRRKGYKKKNGHRQQFKLAKDQYLFVHGLQGDEGASIEFDNVLFAEDAGKFTVGAPTIEGAKVSATILSRLKGDKVIVFNKKRRKGYKKKNGHRQQF